MIQKLLSRYTHLKIIYKLMLPSAVALLLGILFLLLAIPKVTSIQYELKRLEQHYIPALEQSTYNLDQLKNISEKFIFAILAEEEDMLPKQKTFDIIENNLYDIFDHVNHEGITLESVKDKFHRYTKIAFKQARLMLDEKILTTHNGTSQDLLDYYNQTLKDFTLLNQLLKASILSMVDHSNAHIRELFYITAVFIVFFLLLVFFVSVMVYRDFNQRFSLLDERLLALNLISSDKKKNTFDKDKLSELSDRIDTKVKDIEKLKEKTLYMQEIAYHDALTNLYNRRYLKTFEEAMNQDNHAYAIMMVDIDDFKKINDTYGHDVGDDVLMSVASILVKNTRSDDIVIRYGGEEFMLIIQSIEKQIVLQKAERLRKEIEAHMFNMVEKLTISIGVALCSEQHFTLDETIKFADIALYDAKSSGKNRVKLYDSAT